MDFIDGTGRIRNVMMKMMKTVKIIVAKHGSVLSILDNPQPKNQFAGSILLR
jgi:hypothetical protein